MSGIQGSSARFPTTLWSMVIKAAKPGTTSADAALAQLCEAYWYPVYAYIRRHGFDAEVSRDLTQEFFARLLEKDYLSDVSREKGRFRAFLLASTRHFLSNERDRALAQKRGGGSILLPLELDIAEGLYRVEPADPVTPQTVFQRRWALTVLDRALRRVRQESRHPHFDQLQSFLSGDADRGEYARIADDLGVSEGSLKVAVHRLRKQYRQALRAEIAETLSKPEEVENEIRFLLDVLSEASVGR